jgi:hypothetical protein
MRDLQIQAPIEPAAGHYYDHSSRGHLSSPYMFPSSVSPYDVHNNVIQRLYFHSP